jgi:hypothetical protein
MGCHHAGCCATRDPPSAGPSSRCTDNDQEKHQRDHPRSHPWTSTGATTTRAEAEIRQDSYQIASTVCHAATLHLKPCGTTVNRLPLVYKRRRRPPSRGGRETQQLTHSRSLTILAFASINSQGLGGFSSSPASLIAPLYEHDGALQYSATSAHLLDDPRSEPG